VRSQAVGPDAGISVAPEPDQTLRSRIAPAWNWRRARRSLEAATAWCYIGKDVRRRDEIENGAPANTRFPLRGRLHDVAEQMRQPYLRLVSELGRRQADRTGWWASSFASKSPFQTDFFLLVCYKILVLQLVDEWRKRDGSLLVFVEDPWLYADVASCLSGRSDVECLGPRVSLWPSAVTWRARGIASRILCAGYLTLAWLAAVGVSRRRRHVRAEAGAAVGIVSLAEVRSLRQTKFTDPYLGPLDEVLQSHGIHVVRAVFPFSSLSLVVRAARLTEAAWLLIRDLRPQDFLALMKSWKPKIPHDVRMGPYPVTLLLQREVLAEFRTTVFNRTLIVKDVVKRFLSRRSVSTLVYFFENQPWEKMACMAAADVGGVRVIAHQHSTIPHFLMTYFLGDGEHAFTPLPRRILTNGPYATALLRAEGRYPAGSIVEAGSWRYAYLHRTTAAVSRPARTVLVALPVDASLARLMWTHATEAAADLRALSWRLVIKPHPDMPVHRLRMSSRLVRAVEVSDTPFAQLLETAGLVVASGTTVIEAWMRGKRVIRVRYENRLDLDPTVEENGAGIRVAEEDELAQRILEWIQTDERPRDQQVRHPREAFFSPPQPEVWLREIQREP
jgi:hypothetical protein